MGYSKTADNREIRKRVLDTFHEYGNWWRTDRMAEWINTDESKVAEVYKILAKEDIIEMKSGKAKSKKK